MANENVTRSAWEDMPPMTGFGGDEEDLNNSYRSINSQC